MLISMGKERTDLFERAGVASISLYWFECFFVSIGSSLCLFNNFLDDRGVLDPCFFHFLVCHFSFYFVSEMQIDNFGDKFFEFATIVLFNGSSVEVDLIFECLVGIFGISFACFIINDSKGIVLCIDTVYLSSKLDVIVEFWENFFFRRHHYWLIKWMIGGVVPVDVFYSHMCKIGHLLLVELTSFVFFLDFGDLFFSDTVIFF